MPAIKAEGSSAGQEFRELTRGEERQRRIVLKIAKRDPENPSEPLFPRINSDFVQSVLQDELRDYGTVQRGALYPSTIVNARDGFVNTILFPETRRRSSVDNAKAIVAEIRAMFHDRELSLKEITTLVDIPDDRRPGIPDNPYSSKFHTPAPITVFDASQTTQIPPSEEVPLVMSEFWKNWRKIESGEDTQFIGTHPPDALPIDPKPLTETD